ncbi:glucosamine-6-phosphate deaminase [Daejeonella sp.]|uniref:glucosamine-6-phosphate deaminase n=1 Tax=Daejeonella sp. TaxID=2805397 RepID=UPI0030C078D9
MQIVIKPNPLELGIAAGKAAAELIRKAIVETGKANIILATGASQFETLTQLIKEDVDWSRVTMFHLDEYIGLPESSPASFRKYLQERFLAHVPSLKAVYLVNGETAPEKECQRLGDLITQNPIDVALVGIGENGHLAFNDPPADFDTEEPYLVVSLDEECRKQQLGEGWFKTIDDVPKQAISMSVKQILKAKHIICSVPDKRKAEAVRNCLEQAVSNQYPSSILQRHGNCLLYLDTDSAGLLVKEIS